MWVIRRAKRFPLWMVPLPSVLLKTTQMMDEVIVTGYGTFKKSAYAGSAANVKADKIAGVPSVSFQDMLQE